jgi:hypothetical protein
MKRPDDGPAELSEVNEGRGAPNPDAELEAELCAAVRDFETGNYIELTLEQLDRCIETGEWPWPDESSA